MLSHLFRGTFCHKYPQSCNCRVWSVSVHGICMGWAIAHSNPIRDPPGQPTVQCPFKSRPGPLQDLHGPTCGIMGMPVWTWSNPVIGPVRDLIGHSRHARSNPKRDPAGAAICHNLGTVKHNQNTDCRCSATCFRITLLLFRNRDFGIEYLGVLSTSFQSLTGIGMHGNFYGRQLCQS